MDRARAEKTITDRLTSLFTEKYKAILGKHQAGLKQGGDSRNLFSAEPAEISLLKQIKFAGFYEGMAAGILWLALLRSTKKPQKPLVHSSPAAPSTPRFIGIWILDVTVASIMSRHIWLEQKIAKD
jgi:hypothetical protein